MSISRNLSIFADTVSTSGNAVTAVAFPTHTSASSLTFQTNGTTTAMTIDTSQNVGIGTTSPITKLTVSGTQTIRGVGTDGGIYTCLYMDESTSPYTGTFAGYTLSLNTGSNSARTSRLYIDPNGNVGIGTTSINTKFHVLSSALADSIRWTDDTNSTGLLGQIAGASTIYTNTSLAFGTGSAIFSEKMRIDSSGYVLIGTNTLSYGKLTVKSAADAYIGGGIYLQRQANTNGWIILPASNNDLYMGYNNVDKGSFSNTTGAYTVLSDATLKKNIADISYGLDAVKALRPVEYLMIEEEDNSKKHLGFIAQEAQTVLPSSVSEMQGGKLGMDKSEIIPVLVKAIQELSAKVTALESK